MEETNILDTVDKDFNELIHSLEIVDLIISILLPTMLEMSVQLGNARKVVE